MKKVGRLGEQTVYKKREFSPFGGSLYYQRSKREERRYKAKLERAARKKQFKARRKQERVTLH